MKAWPLLSSLFVLQLQTHKIVTRQTPVLYHDGDIARVCLLEQERQHETQTPRSVADAHRAWTGFFQRLWSSLLTCRWAQSKGNTAYPLALAPAERGPCVLATPCSVWKLKFWKLNISLKWRLARAELYLQSRNSSTMAGHGR